ncbi:Naphthalene 1,2-dioxygenase/salicylate 5-hydroxylase system, ferredoxin component [Pirellulimonas nuda]|uniref:Naphthalene 1,2-dioxygenase/salicylate 5-hydroxylase system, ferredoxin component n=1 Tax=Pirellulimonas nuda TaxID=2528009 RepID=A0A518DBA0_9BACT|nr:Rieske 2Fe-2S domain-containing protein [Pirellulimonas nuda]QDU88750.1 Naphthalene 1,2-dioxygenase/salicylate 5-hydroxylase system, ferredoxin component [Pirellulimonas nuda]
MPGFIDVAAESEIPDPGSLLAEVDDRLVVVVHAADHWYALDDVCTHDGGPLSDGAIDPSKPSIACPRHGAEFDLRNGAALTMPATKPTIAHEIKVEGGRVLVRLCGD